MYVWKSASTVSCLPSGTRRSWHHISGAAFAHSLSCRFPQLIIECARRPSPPFAGSYGFCNIVQGPMAKMQRRRDQISRLLRRLRLPPPGDFFSHGNLYRLPLRAEDAFGARAQPSLAQLEYMAGFFDGDGCVSAENSLSGCRLFVAQSA